MSLEAKGTIRFDPDAKIELIMKAPTLYIEEEIKNANPQIDLPELIDLLIKRMTDKIQRDFNRPVTCTLQSYSLNLIVSVEPINNRTLDEFTATVRTSDGREIPLDKVVKTAEKVLATAERTGETPEQVLTRAKAELEKQKAGAL